MSSNGTVKEQKQTKLFHWDRIQNIFINPSNTFGSITKDPEWIGPLFIVILAAIVFTHIQIPHFLSYQQAHLSQELPEYGVSPENIEKAQELISEYGALMIYLGTIAKIFAEFFFVALILLILNRILTKDKITFKTWRALSAYSMLIVALGKIIRIPFILATQNEKFTFSLSSVWPGAENSSLFLKTLIGLDLFSIWKFFILVFGFLMITKIFNLSGNKRANILIFIASIVLLIILSYFQNLFFQSY